MGSSDSKPAQLQSQKSFAYSRVRLGSVVTKSDISSNSFEFRQVNDIKESIENVKQILYKYKTYKLHIRDDFISSEFLGNGDFLVGIDFGGKVKCYDLKDFIFTSDEKILKNMKLKAKAINFYCSRDEIKENEEETKGEIEDIEVTHRIIKVDEKSFVAVYRDWNILLSIPDDTILNLHQKDRKSFIRNPEILSKDQAFSHHNIDIYMKDPDIFYKHPANPEKLKNYQNLKKKINEELVKVIKTYQSSSSISEISGTRNESELVYGRHLEEERIIVSIKIIKFAEHSEDSCVILYVFQKQLTKIEYFLTLQNLKSKKSKMKYQFSRLAQSGIFEPKDKTTALLYSKEEKFVLVGTKLGKIMIYDLNNPERHFLIKTHIATITRLCLIKKPINLPDAEGHIFYQNFILSVSRDKKISKTELIDIRRIKKIPLKNKKNLENPEKMLFPINGEENKNSKQMIFIKKFENQAKKKNFISTYKNSIILNEDLQEKVRLGNIELFEFEDSFFYTTTKSISDDVQEFHSIEIISNTFIVCAGFFKEMRIFKITENFKEVERVLFENAFNGTALESGVRISDVFNHYDSLSSITSCKQYFISASCDGMLKIWKLYERSWSGQESDGLAERRVENCLVLIDQIIAPLGHSLQVTCTKILELEKIFISTSYDNTMKIWKLKDPFSTADENPPQLSSTRYIDNSPVINSKTTIKRLIFTIKNIKHTIRYMVPIKGDSYVLTCCAFGNLNIWCMQTFTTILHMNLNSGITYFNEISSKVPKDSDQMSQRSNFIVYSDGKDFYYFEYYIDNAFILTKINSQNPRASARNSLRNSLSTEESKNLQESNIPVIFTAEIARLHGILGPLMRDLYQAMSYFRKCITAKVPVFNPIYDKFVIFPYLLTSQHIYAFFNLPEHLWKSLNNGTNLSESTLKQSPLSISISKDYEDCVANIIKFLKIKLLDSPFYINFISDTSLIEMNYFGRDSLVLFYQILLIKVEKSNNPRFVRLGLNLPIFRHYPEAIVDYTDLFDTQFIGEEKDSGQSVVFMRSAVSLTLIIGSQRSLDLLQSITECSNINIFSTPFIQAYIDYKMPVIKPFMIFHAGFYCLYLFLLLIFSNMSEINLMVVGFIFILNVLLTIYEIFKFKAFGKNYFRVVWNSIDLVRTLITIFLIFMIILIFGLGIGTSLYEGIRMLFFIATITSFIRGISFFRLFEGTRYFTYLLFKVMWDSVSFMLFMAYNIICVAFLLYVSTSFEDTILLHLEHSFLLVYGAYNPEPTDNIAIWLIFIVALIINSWMILNFMIAVYSNSFAEVSNNAIIQSYKTKAEMAFEVEGIMFWRRRYTIEENSNFSYTHKNDYRIKEYTLEKNSLVRGNTCCERFMSRLKLCFSKPEEEEAEITSFDELLNSRKHRLKEYIHTCRSPEEDQKLNLDLERIRALSLKSKKVYNSAVTSTQLLLKTLSESEQTLKSFRTFAKRGENEGKNQENNKKDSEILLNKQKKVKLHVKLILQDMIDFVISQKGNERKECKKRLAKNIEELLDMH